jgi:uncharacterized protein involved in exopolysaccharide biosynthesis
MTDQPPPVAQRGQYQYSEDVRLQPTEDEDSAIDLLAAFATLKRNKKTIFKITFAFSVLATILALVTPVQYSSTASFIPPTNSSNSTAAALTSQLSSLGASGLMGGVKTPGDLYAGILKSRSIAEVLIKRFNLKEVYKVKRTSEAVKALAGATVIEVGTKDSIINVIVKDRKPERARDLANAYLDALQDTNGRLALTESSQRREFYDQQLAKEKNNLADAEVALKQSEENTGLIAPTGQTAIGLETIARTKAQIAARQIELTALKQSSTEQNPAVIRLLSVISNLEGQLARLEKGGANEIGSIPTAKVPAIQLEYVRRARDVKYHETLFEMIAKQDEIARMDEARDAPLLQVLDAASYPEMKSWPPRTLFVLAGIILGLIAGSAWVLIRDSMNPASS